jgi:hypothetical protein
MAIGNIDVWKMAKQRILFIFFSGQAKVMIANKNSEFFNLISRGSDSKTYQKSHSIVLTASVASKAVPNVGFR